MGCNAVLFAGGALRAVAEVKALGMLSKGLGYRCPYPYFLKGKRMPQPGMALEKLGFLTIGLFDGRDPGPGHQVTLEMIQLGERLGFNSAWVRHRHLQYGISSPVAVLAAASQRTSRIELGTAVIPLEIGRAHV